MILPGYFFLTTSSCQNKKYYSSQTHSLFNLEMEKKKCSFSLLYIYSSICGPLRNGFYLQSLSPWGSDLGP